MNTVLVSVVVNCHNSENYIEECIESIINQSYQNFEVIVWDNKSQDQTEIIVRRLSSLDSRIKYFKSEIFVALGSARNLALAQCAGSWIAFLDSDDLWDRHFVSDQLTNLSGKENNTFGYGFVTEFLQDSSSIKKADLKRQNIRSERFIFNDLLKGNFIYFSSVVFSRQALNFVKNFKEEYKQAEDYELLLRLARKFKALQIGHVYYRLHDNNLSKIQSLNLYFEALDILKKYLEFKEAKISFSYNFAKLALAYFKKGEYVNFVKLAKRSNYKFRYFFVGLSILIIQKIKNMQIRHSKN